MRPPSGRAGSPFRQAPTRPLGESVASRGGQRQAREAQAPSRARDQNAAKTSVRLVETDGRARPTTRRSPARAAVASSRRAAPPPAGLPRPSGRRGAPAAGYKQGRDRRQTESPAKSAASNKRSRPTPQSGLRIGRQATMHPGRLPVSIPIALQTVYLPLTPASTPSERRQDCRTPRASRPPDADTLTPSPAISRPGEPCAPCRAGTFTSLLVAARRRRRRLSCGRRVIDW